MQFWRQFINLTQSRCYVRFSSRHTLETKINKLVLVSTSNNIYENLALEDWLYENADLSNTDYLLMWKNLPAVVIGRHQNPWLECNVKEAVDCGISVARRNSGGGAVYHDEGNLNISFLKSRIRYDRRKNLQQVVQALTSHWDLDLGINSRDDLLINGIYKVSGTASKLGAQRTYHHFTLVFDIDKDTLSSILHSSLLGVHSKATKSVPSVVKNLQEEAPDMTFSTLVQVISQEFLKDSTEKIIKAVNPLDESTFPGILAVKQRLASWEWVYGKTPKFSISRTFVIPTRSVYEDATFTLNIDLTIDKGKIFSFTAHLVKESKIEKLAIPFELQDIADIVGESVEVGLKEQVWEQCWKKVGERKEDEHFDLLVWGLQCLRKCIPQ